jgi:hypothetical protein
MTQIAESRMKTAGDQKNPKTAALIRLGAEAARSGLETLNPPVMNGCSGVNHTFSLLVKSGPRYYGFDEYEHVSQFEVMRTHIKRFDTGVIAQIIDLSGVRSTEVGALAKSYGLSILSPDEFDGIFSRLDAMPKDRFSY